MRLGGGNCYIVFFLVVETCSQEVDALVEEVDVAE